MSDAAMVEPEGWYLLYWIKGKVLRVHKGICSTALGFTRFMVLKVVYSDFKSGSYATFFMKSG